MYGTQKGASAEDIIHLNKGLESLAKIIYQQFGFDAQKIPGAGAAGGMGAGAKVFLDAVLLSGIDLIKEIADFDNAIMDADWIITGEGQLDHQTSSGKTIDGVIKSAKIQGVPVAAFCGSVDIDINQLEVMGLQYATSILNGIGTLEDAKKNTAKNLEMASYNFAKLLKQAQG